MSKFSQAHESADNLGWGNEAPLANGEETQTVAAEILEAQGLAQEAADAESDAEQLDGEHEQAEELAETVQGTVDGDTAQESFLDPTAAKLLKLAFGNIVGKAYANKKIPAMENFESSRSAARENTRLALEGIKDTLKEFWVAIKKQFEKAFNAVKSWIVKTFSAAKKLKARAETIQSKANDTVGTIEEKSFNFSQAKAIAVGGKFNEPGTSLSGLELLSKIVQNTVEEFKKSKLDDAVESIVNVVKASINGSGKTRALGNFNGLRDAVEGTLKGASTSNDLSASGNVQKYKEQFGFVQGENEVTWVPGLPGSRAIVLVRTNKAATDFQGATAELRGNRLTLANDKYNPREISDGDVKTLTTSQVDKACTAVIDMAETVYEYEQRWKQTESYVSKLQKEVDELVRDFEQEDDAADNSKSQHRRFLTAVMSSIRRNTNFKASLCGYAISTGNAYLNYCERSLSNHKAK